MDITVNTRYGSLCGEQKQGYAQFLGVPFAKPPVGELRFRRPQPLEKWDGVRQAKNYANYCFQPIKAETIAKDIHGSEDCLYLNIFTPACDGKKRPVLIWIHGGAYLTGAGSSAAKQGGNMCIHSDIVVVSVQYRLGAFGCVDFGSLSGANGRFDSNCGTWDQVAAVNWVIENIAYHMAARGKVYLHHFDYAFPLFRLLGVGAVHCTNSALTSGEKLTGIYKLYGLFAGKKGKIISRRIHHYWRNFIATGDPNGDGEPFRPQCGVEKNTLFINARCHVEKAPFEQERQHYGLIRPYGN